jgi:hypothetical protein
MKPHDRFVRQPKRFWACVRLISQEVGYTVRNSGQVKVPTLTEMRRSLHAMDLNPSSIADESGHPTDLGASLSGYFEYRAEVLNKFVEPRLMDVQRAKELFDRLRSKLSPRCPLPMNKQKGEKKVPAYFTGIVNMLIEANAEGHPCEYDPRGLIVMTGDGVPIRTLARRVDGAFPARVNPVAVWEIKEYYFTTTFGSRVADGVYETLLDGMELEELQEHEETTVRHYLMLDGYNTWWNDGRSYLCRIIDMLHMGYVDEVLFGREVVERLPAIVKGWATVLRERQRR